MAVIDKKTYALSKKYTDEEVAGGGAIKGKNCTIYSTEAITGGTRITFKWFLDNGTEKTTTVDVMNGQDGAQGEQGPAGTPGAKGDDGLGIKSVSVNAQNHLIITYSDDTTEDAGEIRGGGGASNFSDLLDVDFDNLATGDIPVYNEETEKWENSNAIKLSIEQLTASQQALSAAIEQLDQTVSNKVDKVSGKGLSSNDYTVEDKSKLTNMSPIYLIGSGLNLDSDGKLTASGMEVPIDTELDPTSSNPVQNQAIAVPVEALQASMSNKVDKVNGKGLSTNDYTTEDKAVVTQVPLDISALQASLATKAPQISTYSKNEVDVLIAAITTLDIKVVNALPVSDISTTTIYLVPKSTPGTQNVYSEYICTDATTSPATWELIGDTEVDLSDYAKTADVNTALENKVDKVNGKGLSTNDYTVEDKAVVTQVPLTIQQLSGSLATKADADDLDNWTPISYADADGKVIFDNLNDEYGYALTAENMFPKIYSYSKSAGTTSGIKFTFMTDCPNNKKCKLRIMK